MTSTHLCVRGTWACTTHAVSKWPAEAAINAAFAELGRAENERLRAAVIGSLWPEDIACCCDTALVISESNRDADWIGKCPRCGNIRALAEHKPHRAPAHWSRSGIEAFAMPVVLSTPPWVADVSDHDVLPHPADECESWHPWTRDRGTTRRQGRAYHRLAAPQVLVYHHRHRLPVTVVNDSGRTASQLYETPSMGFDLDPVRFPMRATSSMLNALTAGLLDVALTQAEREGVARLVEAMWMRMPWSGDCAITGITRAWLRSEVADCAHDIGCGEILRWSFYAA